MKEILTALITPFQSDGSVDASALRKLVHTQMEEGADGFIVCGTTAETPTLTREEQRQIIETVLSLTTGRCKVYAGVGTNCTATTIANICSFERYPLDGYLLVTPYYNRPSEEGLFRHFQAAAAVTRKTIMLYHVPSRTASSITVALFERLLAVCPNITALKYAASDYQAMAAFKRRHPQICLYSGRMPAVLRRCRQALTAWSRSCRTCSCRRCVKRSKQEILL
ncbi:MAG: dihydrodipicolinate synthase family protein [Merdibacter sp.]